MQRSVRRLLVFAANIVVMSACAEGPRCDDDQTFDGDLCRDRAPSGSPGSGGAAAAGGQAGSSGATIAQAGSAGRTAVTLDKRCAGHTDCGADAPFCAAPPGKPGACTIVGCLGNAGICPEGWGCVDLSAFDPTLPSICTRP